MSSVPMSVCVATLGYQPQVVTLALDALVARGDSVDEVIVLHHAATHPQARAALERLNAEFVNECYAGRPCRYRVLPMPLTDPDLRALNGELAVDEALNAMQRLFQQLKQADRRVQLCVAGGRRLLGMLAFSVAMLSFDQRDRIWHLHSSELVRRLTCHGAQMHVPDHQSDVQLVRIPLPPWSQLFPALRSHAQLDVAALLEAQTAQIETADQRRCRQVYDRLTERQRRVLREISCGKTPQEIAQQLAVTLATVNAHKTPIFQECCAAWELPPGSRLDYRWLREQFAGFPFDDVA